MATATKSWYQSKRQVSAFSNLSAGQRMMFALIADIAIKAITNNSHLLADECSLDFEESSPTVLSRAPGLVLIDEIDAHLHPKWQRRVVGDLKRLFPQNTVCLYISFAVRYSVIGTG